MTSNEWITMRDFARALRSAAACDVVFNESSRVHWRVFFLHACVCLIFVAGAAAGARRAVKLAVT